ncbi:MAG: alpha/beta fold hydrolase [Gemmatimonadaceae bacterium]|nr:alpha/beta fold hydrolase [Gemmatimonadaceae bacterium]
MIAYLNDRAVAYDDIGTGLPVLFLHGFPHNRSLWGPQLGALAAPARTIAMDLRGFGESAAEGPGSVDAYADDAAALLDTLGIDRAVIAGLSMGGYTTLAFWRRHRERVRALVLCDTRATADTEASQQARRDMQTLANAKGSMAVANQMITGMVGRTTRDKNPELVDELHRMMSLAPVKGIVDALDALRTRPDSTPTLATIDVPTLIVVGDEDVLTPVKDAEAMHGAIPGSRLAVIAGAGHVSNMERPAAFNHVLSEFLVSLTAQ